MDDILKKYKHWKFKNTALLLLSLAVLLLIMDTPIFKILLNSFSYLGYFGIFITGVFFVSTFTVAPASILLFSFLDKFDSVSIAFLAGLGAVLGDYLIFRFFKDKVFEELKHAMKGFRKFHIKHLFHTPFFAWFTPVLGAIIIAVPFFPDEIGVGLIGMTKLKNWQFLVLSFILNSVGILLLVITFKMF